MIGVLFEHEMLFLQLLISLTCKPTKTQLAPPKKPVLTTFPPPKKKRHTHTHHSVGRLFFTTKRQPFERIRRLGGGNSTIFFHFHPKKYGEDELTQFDYAQYFFRMGWFNLGINDPFHVPTTHQENHWERAVSELLGDESNHDVLEARQNDARVMTQ